MSLLIKKFNEIRITDVASVGGKNASLGEMFSQVELFESKSIGMLADEIKSRDTFIR